MQSEAGRGSDARRGGVEAGRGWLCAPDATPLPGCSAAFPSQGEGKQTREGKDRDELIVGLPMSDAVEDLAQSAGEGFGLAGVAELTAEETAVVAGEHRRLLTEQLGGRHCGAPGEGALRLLAHGDHDTGRRRRQRRRESSSAGVASGEVIR